MRILMVNLPFSGHTNPTLPLAAALVRAGHAVTYVNAEEFRGRIEATGARFVPYRDYPAHPTEDDRKTRSFRACWDTALSLRETFDLLIYEMFFYPGFFLAQRLGVPCVRQWSQAAWSVRGWRKRPLRFRLAARLLDRAVMSAADRRHIFSGWQPCPDLCSANLYDRPALNIVYLPEEMQDSRIDFLAEEWVFQPPEIALPAADSFLSWATLKRPIVYASLGSIMSDRGFCNQVVSGFGGGEMTVILNTGRIEPASLGRMPENVRAYSFVPQAEVLRHADVFLTHCGMGSVNEALQCGVPMVMMPVMSDQPCNAARLLEMGLGRRVRAIPMSGRTMYAAAMAVWQDSEMKQRALAMQESVRRQQDMDGLVRRIEEVCGK
ncbi:MAG: hypothetical protein IKK57_02700 [Clostridia bacterium]|nr:hypothetical protein [Clostridia bacterium]